MRLSTMSVLITLGLCLNTLRASAEVTFLGNWANFGSEFQIYGKQTRFLGGAPVEWVAGYGPNHWRIVQERGLDRLQTIYDPTSPKGGAVLKVEVRPGDSVGYTGERAEVSHMMDAKGGEYSVTPQNGHEVYGLSVKLDSNWQPPMNYQHIQYRWGAFLQLHSPDDFDSPPAFSLQVQNRFYVATCAGDVTAGNTVSHKDATNLELTRGDLRQGHWIQFLVDVVWAYDNTGSLAIYRRDENETNFTRVFSSTGLPTLQYSSRVLKPIGAHYWKMGYYRSVSPSAVSVLYLGPLARGTSLAEVSKAAFGKS